MNLQRLNVPLIGLLFGLSACLLTTSCSQGEANTVEKDAKDTNKVSVEVAKVWRGDIQQTYGTITTLQAERSATVVSRTSGILQQLFVEEGNGLRNFARKSP